MVKVTAAEVNKLRKTTGAGMMDCKKALVEAEGKPEAMLDNIAKGKIKRFFKDNTLVNQAFIKDSKQSVAAYVKTIGDVNVTGFKRVALG